MSADYFEIFVNDSVAIFVYMAILDKFRKYLQGDIG